MVRIQDALHDGPSHLCLVSTTPIKIRPRMQRKSLRRSGMTFPLAMHAMLLTLCLELVRHIECSQIPCVFSSCPLSDCPQVGADVVLWTAAARIDRTFGQCMTRMGRRWSAPRVDRTLKIPPASLPTSLAASVSWIMCAPTSGLYFRVLLTLSLCRLERSR